MRGGHSAKTKGNGKQIQIRTSKEELNAGVVECYILLALYAYGFKPIGRLKVSIFGKGLNRLHVLYHEIKLNYVRQIINIYGINTTKIILWEVLKRI